MALPSVWEVRDGRTAERSRHGQDLDIAGGIRKVLNARRGLLGPFRHRLLEAPLGLGRSVWVDPPDVDLGAQVRRVGVPAPGGMREVAALAGES